MRSSQPPTPVSYTHLRVEDPERAFGHAAVLRRAPIEIVQLFRLFVVRHQRLIKNPVHIRASQLSEIRPSQYSPISDVCQVFFARLQRQRLPLSQRGAFGAVYAGLFRRLFAEEQPLYALIEEERQDGHQHALEQVERHNGQQHERGQVGDCLLYTSRCV